MGYLKLTRIPVKASRSLPRSIRSINSARQNRDGHDSTATILRQYNTEPRYRPMPRAKSSNSIDRHVGSRIRMRRTMLDMSLAKLGDALGVTLQQVQKYETGANTISASRLQHISQILQVPASFFSKSTCPPGAIQNTGLLRPTPSWIS